ncbi:GH25 family lysozyme [Dactylosporangium sp. CS-047395]|uniref:GH25 family lysozyme n=1 Tax=Dactylosporangium sp. CS-047395 TaxID=3239936 RepID=UPI003D8C98F4
MSVYKSFGPGQFRHRKPGPRFPTSKRARVTVRALAVLTGLAVLVGVGAAQAGTADDPGGHAQAGLPPGASKGSVSAQAIGGPDGFPILGIDVSSNDHRVFPNIDWGAVATSGMSFAYVKATEGRSYVNPYFSGDFNASKNVGLLTGAYAFARPDQRDPVGEANFFVDHIEWRNDARTLVPFIDLEWPYASLKLPNCWNLTPAEMVAYIHAFSDQIRKRIGRDPMIYTAASWWSECTGNDASFSNNPLDLAYWKAQAPTALPASWTKYAIWQYAGGNNSQQGNYDKNAFNGDYAALTQLAGDLPAIGDPFELRAGANNRYVTADGGGGKPLIANRDAVGAWEQYDLVDLGGDEVGLRSHSNGRYVSADAAGNGALIANRPAVGAWERFKVVENEDGTISLKASINGRYVTADAGGGKPLIANRTEIGAWEKFTKVPVPTVASFRAGANNSLVSAAAGGKSPLIANRGQIGSWEQFDIVDLGHGEVAFRSHANGAYVTADAAGDGPLIANRTAVGAWERFTIVQNKDDNTISIIASINGKYVTADDGGNRPLIANRDEASAWERFSLLD